MGQRPALENQRFIHVPGHYYTEIDKRLPEKFIEKELL